MKKCLALFVFLFSMPALCDTGRWDVALSPSTCVIDRVAIDGIVICVPANLNAAGMLRVSRLSGSNVVARTAVCLSNAQLTNALSRAGTSVPGFAGLIKRLGGVTNEAAFINRVDVRVGASGRADIFVFFAGSSVPAVLSEDGLNSALSPAGGVGALRSVFLGFAKERLE